MRILAAVLVGCSILYSAPSSAFFEGAFLSENSQGMLVAESDAEAAEKTPAKNAKPKPANKTARIKRAQASDKRVGTNARVHRYRANLAMGMSVVRGESSLLMGGQFGYAFWERIPAYLGPEVSFSLNSPQSIFQLLAGGWYQLGIYRSPRMSLTGGIVLGFAFPYAHNVVKSTTLAYYLDITISQEIDDLVSVRGQFRPGFVGENFAFMMNLNVSFRFP